MRIGCLIFASSSTTNCIKILARRSAHNIRFRNFTFGAENRGLLTAYISLTKSARLYSQNPEDHEKLCQDLFEDIEQTKKAEPASNSREEEIDLLMESRKRKNLDESESASLTLANMMLTPHQITLEVLSNGSTHMAPSALLRTPLRCYLFNCPEGASRFAPLLRIRPNIVHDFFITRAVWDNIGGISGILLNKAKPCEAARIHGAKHVKEYLEMQRPFIDADFGGHVTFPVEFEERSAHEFEQFEDAAMRVCYIPLEGGRKTNSSPSNGNGAVQQQMDVAYLVEIKQSAPSIDPLKLIALRIPKGPHIALLKAGQPVTLADGRQIQPEEVYCDQQTNTDSPLLLVAEVESEQKLHSLRESRALQEFMSAKRSRQLNFLVHFSPQPMLELPAYQCWMREFGPDCRHLVLNGSGPVLPMNEGIYASQLQFHSIFPHAFPQLHPAPEHYQGRLFVQDTDYDESRAHQQRNGEMGPVFLGAYYQRFAIRGTIPDLNDSLKMEFTEKNTDVQMDINAQLAPKLDEFRKDLDSALDTRGTDSGPYPQISFLGTASAAPQKYRNVTGHLLQMNAKTVLMIDCGESSYGQMRVLFGPEGCDEVLVKLRALFITHSHQDHVYGIPAIVQNRHRAFQKLGLPFRPLILVCNRPVKRLLDTYSRCFQNIDAYVHWVDPRLFTLWDPKEDGGGEGRKKSQQMQGQQGPVVERRVAELAVHFPRELYWPGEWNMCSAKAVHVLHTRNACGFVFTTNGGKKGRRKIVFSGDTMPCPLLEEHGQDADLLVHEATFEDGFEVEAKRKRHSTMRQAFDSAQRMRAKNVILTHFSSRYSRVPPLPDYLLEAGNVAVSQDNMVVPFDLFPLFPRLLPLYRVMFREELFQTQIKHIQRQFRDQEQAGQGEPQKRVQGEQLAARTRGSEADSESPDAEPPEATKQQTVARN